MDRARFATRPWNAYALPLAIFSAAWLLLTLYADHDGYEGDDLAQIEGSIYLDAKGPQAVYRYFWQPFTYRFAHALARLGAPVSSFFAISPLCVALGLAALTLVLRESTSHRPPAAVIVSLLLLTPELFFTGLYYNSSAPALACATMSLAAALRSPQDGAGSVSWSAVSRLFLAGVLFGTACFLRLDFGLLGPFWIGYLYHQRHGLIPSLAALLGAASVVLCAAVLGDLDIPQIIAIAAEGRRDVVESGWTRLRALHVALAAANVLEWGALALLLPRFLSRVVRERQWTTLAYAGTWVLPLLPLPGLMSGKYLVPALVLLPLALILLWQDAPAALRGPQRSNWVAVLVGYACIVQLVWFHKIEGFPYISPTTQPELLRTEDGHRSTGAYRYAFAAVNELPLGQHASLTFAQLAARVAQHSGLSVELEYPRGSWVGSPWRWGWPALFLVQQGFRPATYVSDREAVVARGQQRFTVRTIDDESPEGRIELTSRTIRIVLPSLEPGEFSKLEQFTSELAARFEEFQAGVQPR